MRRPTGCPAGRRQLAHLVATGQLWVGDAAAVGNSLGGIGRTPSRVSVGHCAKAYSLPGSFRFRNDHGGAGLNPSNGFTQRVCACPSWGHLWESEAQSLRSVPPRAAVGRARLDPVQPVPDSGDGNPPGFWAGNAGKSQKQNSVLSSDSAAVNDFRAFRVKSLTNMELPWNNAGPPANGDLPPDGKATSATGVTDGETSSERWAHSCLRHVERGAEAHSNPGTSACVPATWEWCYDSISGLIRRVRVWSL